MKGLRYVYYIRQTLNLWTNVENEMQFETYRHPFSLNIKDKFQSGRYNHSYECPRRFTTENMLKLDLLMELLSLKA